MMTEIRRYMWVIQIGLIEAGSSMHSLSVLLSAVEMSLRTCTILEIAQGALAAIISTRTLCAQCELATATIQGWHLFRSKLPVVRLLFEGGDYSRAVTIRGWRLIEEIWYVHKSF